MKTPGLFLSLTFVTLNGFAQTPATVIDKESKPLFVPVNAGTFMMGSPDSEEGRHNDETRHSVTLTKDFEIGTTEVTQLQWFDLMGNNPSYFKEEKHCPKSYMEMDGVSLCTLLPIEQVSYEDVKVFLEAYNKRTKEEGGSYTYRLPTEAEWEYAARGGTTTAYSFGDDPSDLADYAWYDFNSVNQSMSVATKNPNPLGLYDVHGNVWEWVEDWYGDYPKVSVTDPKGVSSGHLRIVRGGSWFYDAFHLRSAYRSGSEPGYRSNRVSFRLVRTRTSQ